MTLTILVHKNKMLYDDTTPNKWLFTITPKFLHNYIDLARLNRPIGIWLALAPALCSSIIAYGKIDLVLFKNWILFFLGAIVVRSLGCVVNDFWDMKIDIKISRTKNRPLASGVLSRLQAGIFFIILLILAFVVVINFNSKTWLLSAVGILLISLYPSFKRWFYVPQMMVALVMNYGVIIAWFAMGAEFDFKLLWIFTAFWCWSFGYDLIYAIQDAKDDAKIGLESGVLFFGDATLTIISMLFGFMWVILLNFGIRLLPPIYFIMLIPLIFMLEMQPFLIYKYKEKIASKLFNFNKWIGIYLVSIFLISYGNW